MATYFFYQNEKPISEYAMEFVKGIHDLHCECQNVIFLNSNESLCWMTCEVISL